MPLSGTRTTKSISPKGLPAPRLERPSEWRTVQASEAGAKRRRSKMRRSDPVVPGVTLEGIIRAIVPSPHMAIKNRRPTGADSLPSAAVLPVRVRSPRSAPPKRCEGQVDS